MECYFVILVVLCLFTVNCIASNFPHESTVTTAGSYDEQLYSRQMLVYGQSAQQRLFTSNVLVIGDGPLAAEIIKNLALAGVGKLSITESKDNKHVPLLGDCGSLIEFAKGLNPNVKVVEVSGPPDISNGNYTLVVATESSFHDLLSLDASCRASDTRLVACDVRGVCGYIFNDFLDGFTVLDVDGEVQPEVPIAEAKQVEEDEEAAATAKGGYRISLSCIPEEKLNCGLGEVLEITLPACIVDGVTLASKSISLPVIKVRSTREVVVQLDADADSNLTVEALIESIRSGSVTAKRAKVPVELTHHSLHDQLATPSFVASNECSAPPRDRALCLILLAAFRAYDNYMMTMPSRLLDAVGTDADDGDSDVEEENEAGVQTEFEKAVEGQLLAMGITDPRKSIKEGGVGTSLLTGTTRRFLSCVGGRCPATVSVIGALAAQEAVKGCTRVLSPLSQWLMFESLDSLDPERDNHSNHRHRQRQRSGRVSEEEAVYGHELIEELRSLRILVVGAGAIGCELLKTMALLGVSTGGTEDDPSSEGIPSSSHTRHNTGTMNLWSDMKNGGIVITDMDHIETSNLNRQLLFRQQHVGMPKSVVAAERVRLIPSGVIAVTETITVDDSDAVDDATATAKVQVRRVRIHPLTLRMDDSKQSRTVFNDAFWTQTDVVLTALDNVDARRFVDSQCVKHRRWLLDSGTLGTKGNTQVVIPHTTESYSSSVDPPEDAIPMCTLKSFPYLPEHCISWAKAMFDELYSARLSLLDNVIRAALSGPTSSDEDGVKQTLALTLALEQLSDEERRNLFDELSYPVCTPQSALEWALLLFQRTFKDSVEALLREHPADQMEEDEDGNKSPFWGGGRRVPVPSSFDISNPVHRSFIVYGAMLWGRSRGVEGTNWSRDNLENILDTVLVSRDRQGTVRHSSWKGNVTEMVSALDTTVGWTLVSALTPQEFEKDVAELGHVDFVCAAANLRCAVYGIRAVDRLETQRVAGRIVPAVATTTALVSGLVCLELVKLAGERLRLRRQRTAANPNNNTPDTSSSSSLSEGEKDRLLARFRNAFVNVARPMLAFAQPVAAETYSLHSDSDSGSDGERTTTTSVKRQFTLWDVIEVPLSANKPAIKSLERFLKTHYGAYLQSVSCRDNLVFADFLPGADHRRTLDIRALLVEPMEGMDVGHELSSTRDNAAAAATASNESDEEEDIWGSSAFVDLDVSCVDEDGNELRLPPVRVFPTDTGSEEGHGGDGTNVPTGATTSVDFDIDFIEQE
eukprot:gene3343-6615_t